MKRMIARLCWAVLVSAGAGLPGGSTPQARAGDEPAEGSSALLSELKSYRHKIVYETNRDGNWELYLCNADGSNVRFMVKETPSYFHGWSPDGKYLAYVHQHAASGGGPANYDIFRIPSAGGESEQLDSNTGYDDGPDYSPDGKWIYFNSDRSGKWDVWRIPANGAGPGDQKAERITNEETEDWFPHPSPDGKQLLFLSFAKGTKTHNDKLPGTQLRMMPMPGAKPSKTPKVQVVTTFFGGQGTINVNSWAPDSKRFAYVIYEPLPAAVEPAR